MDTIPDLEPQVSPDPDAPADTSTGAPPRVYVEGVYADQLEPLGAIDFVDQMGEADLIVVSTRIPRSGLGAVLAKVRNEARCPVVALTHTGGETLAVEIMRAGGTGVVAEGNEQSLPAFLTGSAAEGGLVATYDRRMGGRRDGDAADHGVDTATNLPGVTAFEQRIEDLGHAGTVPRVAFLHVRNLEPATRRMAAEATTVLRRRLATQYRELTRSEGVELYVLDRSDFALLGVGLSPNRAEELGRQLARITEAFAPANQTLKLAIGHAGPEVTDELGTLRELAQRALSVAAEQPTSAVVGADSLSLGLASTTELEAALRTLGMAERDDPNGPGHGMRVARLASELAWTLGFEAAERSAIRLAGHFHDIGKVGLPPDLLTADPETLTGERLAEWREHARRSAAYLRPLAGDELARAVTAHHEHWDGTGFPDGLAGEDIPVTARLVAIADVYDKLLLQTPETENPVRTALDALAALAGTQLDPAFVEAAIPLFARLSIEDA